MASIKRTVFGRLSDGTVCDLYTLEVPGGITAQVTNYGANLVSLFSPDRQGNLGDIVLGYADLDGYENDYAYLGATTGRCCNRIVNGSFELDGAKVQLSCNNDQHHLHGGFKGFNKVVWQARELNADYPALSFSYRSPDGEEGYPGNLDVEVQYRLLPELLRITFIATTDRHTVVNLTNHSYFNLNCGCDDVLNHELLVAASRYNELDGELLPTGKLVSVEGTAYDFRAAKPLSRHIMGTHGGYDRNLVLDDDSDNLRFAARLSEPESGRVLDIYTTEPGLQIYSGNYLDGFLGKNNQLIERYFGLCLEAQHLPDSPNHPNFPPIDLLPGEIYTSQTEWRFSSK